MDVPAGNDKAPIHEYKHTTPSVVPELVSEFCQETSLHGVRNVYDSKKYKLRGVVWSVALICMTFTMIISMADIFTEYYQYPLLTRINVGFAEKLPFPAVTLCNLNPVDRTKVEFKKLEQYFLAFTQVDDNVSKSLINWDDPALLPFKLPMNKSYVRQISPDLNSMLYGCLWEGKYLKSKCSKNFTENFTELGICYTFNSANYSELYGPLYTSHTGSSTGLVLYFYINESTYIYNEDMASGVKILLHHPQEVPDAKREGIFVSPGFATRVNLKFLSYKFLAWPYKAFPNSFCLDTTARSPPRKLKYHLHYSYNACVRECRIDFIINKCGCHSVYEPGEGPTCSGRQLLNCRMGVVAKFDSDPDILRKCNCLPPCTFAQYQTQISSAHYPSNLFNKILMNVSSFIGQPRERFLEVRLFFETLLYHEIMQVPQYTLLNIMGIVGGQMGLYLGASILTISELAEFICIFILSATHRLLTCKRRLAH